MGMPTESENFNMTKQETIAGSAENSRALQLQFLRFLAFMNIFLHHSEEWNFLGYPVQHAGAFAVSFFFMLSGLVTGWSAFGKNTPLTFSNVCVAWWKRARKIYPLYVLTILLALLPSGFPELVAERDWLELRTMGKQLGANLLMLQSWPSFYFGNSGYTFNGEIWFLSSLSFLWLFNVLGEWILQKIEKSRGRYVILGTVFCGLMVATVCYCRMTQNLDMTYWHYVFPPARLGEYLGGMVLGFSIRSFLLRWDKRRQWRAVFTVLEVAALAFWGWSLRRAGNYWMNHIVAWLIPNTFLLAVFTFGGGWISEIFRTKPLVHLGDISFECYMLHQMIIIRYISYHFMESWGMLDQVVASCFCLTLSILGAHLLHQTSVGK